MPLTPDDARRRFLNSVPRRRDEFANRFADYRDHIFHKSDYMRRYPKDVFRMCAEEMRERNKGAEECVRALLDSGWKPDGPNQIQPVFTRCFAFDDYRKDPFSDLYERVDAAFSDIGQPDPPGSSLRFRLGEVQVAAVSEAVSNLESYSMKSMTTIAEPTGVAVESSNKRGVFIVHGRDEAFANAMADFIRAAGLEPIEWEQAVKLTGKASPYIGEVLDSALGIAQAILILLTPDNEARLRPGLWGDNDGDEEKLLRFHPRQNVIFEAGMALAMVPERTALVVPTSVSIASDIVGRNFIRFSGDDYSRNQLLSRLEIAGCTPNRTGQAWLRAGNFPDYQMVSVTAHESGRDEGRRREGPTPPPAPPFDEQLFSIQPTLTIRLGNTFGGPSGHFLGGEVENVGRGIARQVILHLPSLFTQRIAPIIKAGEAVQIGSRYDDKDCFLKKLDDAFAVVEFEDEIGTLYRQEGEVSQKLTPGGSIWTYTIDSFAPPTRIGLRTLQPE